MLYEEYGTKFWICFSTSSATPTPHEIFTKSSLEDDLNYVSFPVYKSISLSFYLSNVMVV